MFWSRLKLKRMIKMKLSMMSKQEIEVDVQDEVKGVEAEIEVAG
jgi:hypothetical protein